MELFQEKGFRDALVVKDSISWNDDNTINLDIFLTQGERYKFGSIAFLGNTVFTDQQLQSILRIEPGVTYNGKALNERVYGDGTPESQDITNTYLDNGYLFSRINAVETSADNNTIALEIRIMEDEPASIRKVTVKGNDVTNDHVLYREIRTKPGDLFSKSDIVRSIRELGQLGFIDPENIVPDVQPNFADKTADIEYSVSEKGSSQIELQGGYGGGGFIGTLGLSFNNFSLRNIFNGEAYKPVPRGDGQSLALRLQASQFFQTYSFSFSEPWLGGRKPFQLSSSISYSKQFQFNPGTRRADRSQSFNILGVTVGVSTRLQSPDNYFLLSHSLSFQNYDLNNFRSGLFQFQNGTSNNLAYTIGLTRNSTYNDPIYPTGGSNFSVSAKVSLPYSLFNGVDYASLREERDDPNTSAERIAQIDQERFKWLEFYKVKFKADWYTEVAKKLVLRPSIEFGFLGAYNNDRGVIPFERFFLGGDGLGNFALDGREIIQLRGYPNQSLSSQDGGSIYNKFSLELRYPVTIEGATKIFGLGFVEGGASVNSFRDFNPFNLQRSAGLGIRIFMPAFGLLGIDFGHGFDPLPGQSQKNGWETHFIIGQQF